MKLLCCFGGAGGVVRSEIERCCTVVIVLNNDGISRHAH